MHSNIQVKLHHRMMQHMWHFLFMLMLQSIIFYLYINYIYYLNGMVYNQQ